MLKTGIIQYNLLERGRELTGQARNFDTRKVARFINSPKFQESVKHRDIKGYLGHWVRKKFGLNPDEAAIDKGKLVALEPAIVTLSIQADDTGNIEHEVQFLDTQTGRVAQKMHASGFGGFSSVIDPNLGEFYGFDYVHSPNYSTNRGYAMAFDDASHPEALFDDIMHSLSASFDYAKELEAINAQLTADSLTMATRVLAFGDNINDERSRVQVLMDEVKQLKTREQELTAALDQATAIKQRGKAALQQRYAGAASFFDAVKTGGIDLEPSSPSATQSATPNDKDYYFDRMVKGI